MKSFFKNIGPGPLIAAAFIGPGTVTLCSIVGVDYGYALLWAMLLSVLSTLVLQNMSSRLGLITQKGLSQILKEEIKNPILKALVISLVIIAIFIGNTAYEAGNISGGVLGLESILSENISALFQIFNINLLPIILGLITFVILFIGNYKVIERVLVSLVMLMSLAFLITGIITFPNIKTILNGLFIPKIPEGSLLTIIGLIGTTVVPYNIQMFI